VRAREYRVVAGNGNLTVTLTFKGAAALKLSLVPGTAAGAIARRAGVSPLHLERAVRAGTIRLVVGGGKRVASFVLTVSYAKGTP
jgi:hypothetical protein